MRQIKRFFIVFFFLIGIFSTGHSQDTIQKDTLKIDTMRVMTFNWKQLAKGVEYCETDAPKISVVNDSKLSILKMNPAEVEFVLLTATEHDKKPKTVAEWADSFDLNIAFNAGMYDVGNMLISKGFLKNYDHHNNRTVHPTYNSAICFNPKDSTASRFEIFDLTCQPMDSIKEDYCCIAQGLRMIDCNGKPLGWNKRKQSCSMLITASDEAGNIYLIFTRSPYTHNEMIQFILSFPFKINSAIYMEGGPETSFYINIGDTKIEKVGSYISNTYANDKNDHFWPIPNVIGVRVK